MARVGALQHDHALIVAEPLIDLTVADIDCVDLRCPPLKQTIRESACACPQIRGDPTLNVDAKPFERMIQFFSATADEPRLHG